MLSAGTTRAGCTSGLGGGQAGATGQAAALAADCIIATAVATHPARAARSGSLLAASVLLLNHEHWAAM